jgi:zinc/manganese transport system ATP-binding protein
MISPHYSKLPSTRPALQLQRAGLRLGERWLWQGLDLEVQPGEFVAVLGPNGSGKTSLLKVLLGLIPLSSGRAEIEGKALTRGSNRVGYIPQRQAFSTNLSLRGRDLVRLGLDGHKFGLSPPNARADQMVAAAIDSVGASAYVDAPIGQLSGGEQQRLRIAQALVSDPRVLLCDEPLLSLDLSHQQAISALIDARRRQAQTAVLFVTHEINPVLPLVDKVLYLVGGKFAIGQPADVLTSETLTELYGAPIDVLNIRGRLVVVGTGEAALNEAGGHHHASVQVGRL